MESERLSQLFQFLSLDPDDAFTRYSIAYEYMQLENPAEAIRHFRLLLEAQPDYLGAYLHYGGCLLHLGKRDEAEGIFETGMQKARAVRDQHALAELQAAYNNLLYDE
ncbi:MAG: tetratricopeptide repeat protein [Bacteroidia bacterium]